MDAFRNYNNLYSGLLADIENKDETIRANAEAKESSDEMGKSLGEVKAFLSGSHGSKTFSANLKAQAKKKAEQLAERAKSSIKKKAEDLKGQVKERINQAKQDAQDKLDDAQQSVKDRFSGEPTSDQYPEENPLEQEQGAQNENPTDEQIGEDADIEEIGEGATLRMTHFGDDDDDDFDEDFDDFKSTRGEDAINEGRAGTGDNPISHARQTANDTGEADSQTVTDEPELPSGTLKTTTFDGTFPEGDDLEIPGNGEAGAKLVAEQTNKGLAKQVAEKQVEKGAEKTAGKVAGEEVGEEAGMGALDAVPGLDVIGFLGGIILGAIERHKQRKEERIAEAGASGSMIPNQAVQVGVGGE